MSRIYSINAEKSNTWQTVSGLKRAQMASMKIPNFNHARVLVAGDVMLDRYWHGTTSRISPEAPVPVVHVNFTEDRPGGAANVAVNIAALGGQATLIGLTGMDEAAVSLEQQLKAEGVRCQLERLSGCATIRKLRALSRHQQMIRLDFEDAFPIAAANRLLDRFEHCLPNSDVVLLSDYAKGTLGAIRDMIALSRRSGKRVVVDPKGRDFSQYRGVSLITPNLSEFEAIVGKCCDRSVLIERGVRLHQELALEALLITCGEEGMVLIQRNQMLHLPADAREVYDVTGAGDTVVAVLATAIAAGSSLEDAVRLANLAAGIVVGKMGTASVKLAELQGALHPSEVTERRVLSEEELVVAVAAARARGETIVMTNGCFDLLHAGHVAYLEKARTLGDRLIVAVNDDASVQRLKGMGRPVIPLDQRMAVLAGLRCVDWVAPFSEDTPERLIAQVMPDALVKGGDYHSEQVAGGGLVKANGGRVVVLGYKPDCSTSRILEQIWRQRAGAAQA
jgi:D-beta-D-heptose 7-phosphate kinase/D-beta-D-heptose 1-phosphate adenosyltransferase